MKYAVTCNSGLVSTLKRMLAVEHIKPNFIKNPHRETLVLLKTEEERNEAARLLSLITNN